MGALRQLLEVTEERNTTRDEADDPEDSDAPRLPLAGDPQRSLLHTDEAEARQDEGEGDGAQDTLHQDRKAAVLTCGIKKRKYSVVLMCVIKKKRNYSYSQETTNG